MWYYGKEVRYVSSYTNSKWSHAIMNGISGHTGWLQIAPSSTDGVTNVLGILTAAVAHQRKVNVNIDGTGKITAAYMS